jgi:hypothetical protein
MLTIFNIEGDSLLWSERRLFECFHNLTERNLVFSTTIHVVEYRFRQAPLCKSQQVIYATRGCGSFLFALSIQLSLIFFPTH